LPVPAGQLPRIPEPHTKVTAAIPPVSFEALALAYCAARLGAQVPVAQLLATASAALSAPFCSSARFW